MPYSFQMFSTQVLPAATSVRGLKASTAYSADEEGRLFLGMPTGNPNAIGAVLALPLFPQSNAQWV